MGNMNLILKIVKMIVIINNSLAAVAYNAKNGYTEERTHAQQNKILISSNIHDLNTESTYMQNINGLHYNESVDRINIVVNETEDRRLEICNNYVTNITNNIIENNTDKNVNYECKYYEYQCQANFIQPEHNIGLPQECNQNRQVNNGEDNNLATQKSKCYKFGYKNYNTDTLEYFSNAHNSLTPNNYPNTQYQLGYSSYQQTPHFEEYSQTLQCYPNDPTASTTKHFYQKYTNNNQCSQILHNMEYQQHHDLQSNDLQYKESLPCQQRLQQLPTIQESFPGRFYDINQYSQDTRCNYFQQNTSMNNYDTRYNQETQYLADSQIINTYDIVNNNQQSLSNLFHQSIPLANPNIYTTNCFTNIDFSNQNNHICGYSAKPPVENSTAFTHDFVSSYDVVNHDSNITKYNKKECNNNHCMNLFNNTRSNQDIKKTHINSHSLYYIIKKLFCEFNMEQIFNKSQIKNIIIDIYSSHKYTEEAIDNAIK